MKKHSLKWLTGLSIIILFATLYFGLRPKDFDFSNNVRWIQGQPGLRFDKYGIAYTEPMEELREENRFGKNGFLIEMAVRPSNNEDGFNFIFTLHNGNFGGRATLRY